MITEHDFEQDGSSRQFFQKSPTQLPCLCRFADPKGTVQRHVPWHWHSEIEINYVTEGTWLFSTIDHEYELTSGDIIFVNAGSLHTTRWKDGTIPGKFISIIFDADFLCGIYGNLLDQKYIHPIVSCAALQGYVIHPLGESGLAMAQNIINVWRLFRDEPYGYEFAARSELTVFWCRLLEETEAVRSNPNTVNLAANVIKPMIEYIHTHYMEKLTLTKIAEMGSVSTRECNRIFHKYIHATPIDYVNAYRLRMAAHALLKREKSIAQIAEESGFSSTSYMAKMFREAYHCTPGEFRAENN